MDGFLCHGTADCEPWIAPAAALEDGAKLVSRNPHILKPYVERGEAESRHIRGTEITDHTLAYQSLHDLVAVRMGEGNVTATLVSLSRTHQLQVVSGT